MPKNGTPCFGHDEIFSDVTVLFHKILTSFIFFFIILSFFPSPLPLFCHFAQENTEGSPKYFRIYNRSSLSTNLKEGKERRWKVEECFQQNQDDIKTHEGGYSAEKSSSNAKTLW